MFLTYVYAQTSGAVAGPSFLEQMMPWILIFGVFYFFLIRPQVKQRKQHAQFLSQLKKGDEVITMSGFLGKIDGLTETFITLEIASGIKVKILRNQIAGPVKEVK